MYIPSAFRVDDRPTLYDFIEQHSFGTLVTLLNGSPFASHIPFLLDRERGVLLSHVARANPQGRGLDGTIEALVMFQGPHAYVSPSWYTVAPAVPTWNYAAVHVYGVRRLLDEAALLDLLHRLVRRYESGRQPSWPMALPPDYERKMLQAIIGFEIPLTRVEGKFKLSQNRSAEDRHGVIEALRIGDDGERALAEMMVRFAGAPSLD